MNKNKNKKSNKPYVLKIKKFKKNEELLNSNKLLESILEFSPLSGSEFEYNP